MDRIKGEERKVGVGKSATRGYLLRIRIMQDVRGIEGKKDGKSGGVWIRKGKTEIGAVGGGLRRCVKDQRQASLAVIPCTLLPGMGRVV